MNRILEGRGALIAGASQGLGRAIAGGFVRQGASVAICARDPVALAATSHELSSIAGPGQQVLGKPCDVSRPAEVEELAAWATGEIPGLDVLVNCAGIYGPKGPAERNDWEEWVEALQVNLLGAVLLTREMIPRLRQRGEGKIIQLSGGGATAPMPRLSAYAASKAAVVRYMETLAVELAPDRIDVNCIAPGALNTRMLDEVLAAGPDVVGEEFFRKAVAQKESGGTSPERGAALAVFLASRASDGITGRLISAVWDPWESLPVHREELSGTDIYTLRRIVPEDRSRRW